MLCDLVKNKDAEKNVVDMVCSKQTRVPVAECEEALTKVWDVFAAKECASTAVESLPPAACGFMKNTEVETKVVDVLCSKQSRVPAAECQAALTKLWDLTVAKECTDTHPDRLAQIIAIQNMVGVKWRAAAHARFATEAPGASKTLNGVKGDWTKHIDAAVQRGSMVRYSDDMFSNDEPPESFDSATQWPHCAKIIDDIRDQSMCGCCWAFAGAEAASDRMCIATNGSIMVPLSAQDVCFCANDDGCDGGQIDTPWEYIKENGAVSGGQYHGSGPFGKGMCLDYAFPHCHHHGPQGSDPYPAEGSAGCPQQKSPSCAKTCDSDADTPHKEFAEDKYSFSGKTVTAGGLFGGGVRGVKKLIMAGGPVETAFTVNSDFENYAGGIYHHVSGGEVGGHAVKIVGWGVEDGVKYWKVANSWNPYWGEHGYFRIREGEGGIDSSVIGSSPDSKWGKKSDFVQTFVV
eukprot:TRINITY_DN7048_c0_g2_i1.p1 TRINITY_DN7048_c0_g2~~TRINITY_DN7048_c0_g2_i1.p1  ORF type:complete len:461 (+),score=85.16 TRINITY_DN7048_c0_g2_i1:931-2313(+)